jgi:hypothetical protein
LSATVWTGGHLFIALTLLPNVLKSGKIEKLLDFEYRYERIGMPALLLQVITGIYLAYWYQPDMRLWIGWENHISKHITIKLALLAVTVICALIANKVLIPNIYQKGNLQRLSVLIYIVTLASVMFVLTGLSFRVGIF